MSRYRDPQLQVGENYYKNMCLIWEKPMFKHTFLPNNSDFQSYNKMD